MSHFVAYFFRMLFFCDIIFYQKVGWLRNLNGIVNQRGLKGPADCTFIFTVPCVPLQLHFCDMHIIIDVNGLKAQVVDAILL